MENISQDQKPNYLGGWIALSLAPLFFSTNIIFGRAAVDINPFTLAAIRWSITGVILLIIIRPHWALAWRITKENWKSLLVASFTAMWICGGVVYLALQHTTATNGTLIYTTPPLMIILIEYFRSGRPIKRREIFGIIAAMTGILLIISKGDIGDLFAGGLNPGDLMFLMAAISWSIYSIILKSSAFANLPILVLFALTAILGAMMLFPVALYETISTNRFPTQIGEWKMIGGIVVFSSLLSFSTYQYGLKVHGASTASIFMYLLPPFGLGLAWLFLNEVPSEQILIGCLLVLGGVVTATWPKKKPAKAP